ncbi:MAG: type II toxin-antitoxin system HicB family antitoxin [Candidatus Aenigmarchaeota archaeon]|nr:type II toxin-antitoxin system HicB family antitoxin [Candidatus Aenigmarchaeota archaeon]
MEREKISGLTAAYRKVKEGYIAYVEEIPGVNTQGATLEETKENLLDALKMVLEANREITERELAGKEILKEKISINV